ncbi:hypothetical protein MMC31_005719 [Peltigera leucophlebia]|nr:hypothetical protein [Peltigera leucophlebia]
MAQYKISMCSRTSSQERSTGVFNRTLKSCLSVWDCLPKHVIDAQLKDADDEPLEAHSSGPRELSTINECDEGFDGGQQDDQQFQANSPEPPRNESPVPEYNNDEKDDELLEADSLEPRGLFSFQHESPVLEHDDDEKDNEPLEAGSPAPRRLFPKHPALNLAKSSPSDMNPSSQNTAMTKRMMIRLHQGALNIDDCLQYMNSTPLV